MYLGVRKFTNDNIPVSLYHGIGARYMLNSRLLLNITPERPIEIDMNHDDLYRLWNYIYDNEIKKRQK